MLGAGAGNSDRYYDKLHDVPHLKNTISSQKQGQVFRYENLAPVCTIIQIQFFFDSR